MQSKQKVFVEDAEFISGNRSFVCQCTNQESEAAADRIVTEDELITHLGGDTRTGLVPWVLEGTDQNGEPVEIARQQHISDWVYEHSGGDLHYELERIISKREATDAYAYKPLPTASFLHNPGFDKFIHRVNPAA